SVTDDVLESDPAGVIVDGDPGLKADLCHVDVPSAAVNAGTNVGVNDDIDGEGRPPGAGGALRAHAGSGTPAPPPGTTGGGNDDRDGGARPRKAGVDLGADEFSGTPAPPCGISNLICN